MEYVRKYTMEVVDKDGKLHFNKFNDGFTAWEILAFTEWNKEDILKQMGKSVRPTNVKRTIMPPK